MIVCYSLEHYIIPKSNPKFNHSGRTKSESMSSHNCHASGKPNENKRKLISISLCSRRKNSSNCYDRTLKEKIKKKKEKVESKAKNGAQLEGWGRGRGRKLSRKWHKYILKKSRLSEVKTIFFLRFFSRISILCSSPGHRIEIGDRNHWGRDQYWLCLRVLVSQSAMCA